MKTLIVDDSRTQRLLLISMLAEIEITDIDEASSADEAIEITDAVSYDLILLDIHMPGKDGLSFLDELRQRSASPNKRTPVIMVSSDSGREHMERARELGACGYLTKPFSVEGLGKAVARARGRK